MDLPRDADCSFYKGYLYPVGIRTREEVSPRGSVEITLVGDKGRLKWDLFGINTANEQSFSGGIAVMMCNESNGQAIVIRRPGKERFGNRYGQWDFAISVPYRAQQNKQEKYAIKIFAQKYGCKVESGTEQMMAGYRVLMEGIVLLPGEVNYSRAIRLNREVKAKRDPQIHDKNPLFQAVQPFEPPLPNTRWWQISILPDLDHTYRQDGFCPRQKQRAVF